MVGVEHSTERYLVASLFLKHREWLREQPFTSEADRWMELVVSLMLSAGRVSVAEARAAASMMASLNLISVSACSRAEHENNGGVMERILRDNGFAPEEAATAKRLIAEVADLVQREWDGKIQKYLRAWGERMLSEIPREFPVKTISEAELRHAFAHWLQSVLGLPVLLLEPEVVEYARQETTTAESLIAAADPLDLNVALLDDAICREVAAKKLGSESHSETNEP